jgi:TRAP transporter TAXI family solute receptor
MSRGLQRAKDIAGAWGLAILVLIAGLIVAYQFVGPPPPKRIVMATGEAGGAYQRYGELYAEYLAKEGITLKLRATAGSVENLGLLDANDEVDLGFVQSGLAEVIPTSNVVALGSLYLEPLWLFLHADLEIEDIGELTGRKIAVGAEGSGTRAVVLTLLNANGIDAENTQLLGLPSTDATDAFARGDIDAAFIIAGPESATVASLIDLDDVVLHDFDRAAAYARLYPYLSPVLMPEGVLNLDANLPGADVRTIAPSAMLAANSELHPALIDLLLVAATGIHGGHSLLADAGQFPTPRYADLPLSPEAMRHFQRGPPFLMRYLPFWAATLIDRLWVMLLPLIGLAIPLVKLMPPAYRWRIRRRLLRMYEDLEQLDPVKTKVQDDADLGDRMQELDRIDHESALIAVPRGYTDDVYKLRRDIDLVRRRLNAARDRNAQQRL